jgi:ATP/maltotriose-dependent transcriptional regulator MalT
MDGAASPPARAGLLPSFVQVAVAAGDLDAAEAAADELETLRVTFDAVGLEASALAARGRVLLARGDAPGARASLQRALEQWRALDVPYEAATTGALLGQALRECDDDEAAVAAFAEASARFDQIGARLDARLATADPGPPPPRPAGLTEREVEVLRLVAAGLSNNDIAATLFLSSKTVSRHLSNVFTKIGVNSRAAATAFAFERGLVEIRPSPSTSR